MPWSFILELHGWWHILTGIGAYICKLFIVYIRSFAFFFEDFMEDEQVYTSLNAESDFVPPNTSKSTNHITPPKVIALVEYLTSEEAGQALGSSFAWPVGLILGGRDGTKLGNVDEKDRNGQENGLAKTGRSEVKRDKNGMGYENGYAHVNGEKGTCQTMVGRKKSA